MTDYRVVDFDALRALITAGTSGLVEAKADLYRALAEIEWNANANRPAPTVTEPEAEDIWLTPEEAAAIARVPKPRIYSWAKGQRWASRPSRRALRIQEKGFRRWLASRG